MEDDIFVLKEGLLLCHTFYRKTTQDIQSETSHSNSPLYLLPNPGLVMKFPFASEKP